jgi:hypothetical protein
MVSSSDLRALAQSILDRNRASRTARTPLRQVSQQVSIDGTLKAKQVQGDSLAVPLSHPLGLGRWDTRESSSNQPPGLHPYSKVLFALQAGCPAGIDNTDWRQAITDFNAFLATWGQQAYVLGWTAGELLGLPPVPTRPAPSFRRLSRYDLTGLIWHVRGHPVVALTESSAAIQGTAGVVTVYRKYGKPALGPLGDSLDELDPDVT